NPNMRYALMPKSVTTVQIRPDSSTPGICGAHAHLIERLSDLAPTPIHPALRADSDDLEERGALIENAFMAFEDFVLGFLTDTAGHSWAVHLDRKYLEILFHDLRLEAAGTLFRAAETVEEVQEAA